MSVREILEKLPLTSSQEGDDGTQELYLNGESTPKME